MDNNEIKLERDFDVYHMCSLCFSTAQIRKLYDLKFGGTNNSSVKICSKCLKKLNHQIDIEV